MADFSAVLRKTLEGMANPTPEMRAKVYERARATIRRQIEAMPSPPPQAAIDRQFEKLDAAIAEIETGFDVEAFEPDVDDLDALFNEPAISAPAQQPQRAQARREDPLEAFLTDQRPGAEAAAGHASGPAAKAAADHIHMDGGDIARPAGSLLQRSSGLIFPAAIAAGVLVVIVLAVVFGGSTVAALFGGGERAVTQTNSDGIPVRTVPSITVTPDDTVTAPQGNTDANAGADGAEDTTKFTQRLTEDGVEIDAGPASGADRAGEGTTVAGQTADDTGSQPAAGGTADAGGQEAAGPDSALPVGQRAIFYQERTGSQAGTAQAGATIWSIVQESPGGDAPLEPAIRAEANVPELGLTLELTIRRNTDTTFPASHMIELFFRMPETFEGRGIADVQRITYKSTEQDPGNALIGVAAPIDTNIFLIALTDAETAVETNLNLMQQQEWIDIPMQYVSGRRALITLEKGIPGKQVFDQVIEAWRLAAAGQ